MTTGAAEHLTRLLALVPYLLTRQGISLQQAAADAGVTPDQLEKDLYLLFCCGTPGHLPDDLIEAEWSDGQVFLGNADTIARPLRLGVEESAALLVGLQLLAGLPGAAEHDALDRTMAKLTEVAGSALGPAEARVGVASAEQVDPLIHALVRDALASGRRLHLSYHVPGRDEDTEREVDPLRIAVISGRTYLQGWCYRAEAVRKFRLDRMLDVRVLDTPSATHPEAGLADVDAGLFGSDSGGTLAEFECEAAARWVSEYYPCEDVVDLPGGRTRVRIRSGDPAWLVRLALRLGPTATLLEPPELVAQVRTAAGTALALYPDSTCR
ncbi:MAG: helix-turn-helix transcriptional regulator [Sporichthyaceae bacterium]